MPTRTIVAFGHFDLTGARSWVIRTGLQERGYAITLCRTEAKGIIGKYRDLWRQWQELGDSADAIYVVFLGHYLLPLAWLLARQRRIPVIFDAFFSLHDTEVLDRKRVSRFSPYAWFLYCTDWLCCRLASVVLLDTEEHKNYFIRSFGVPPEKILVLPIGCRTDLFLPHKNQDAKDQPFRVLFHGTFIPLQGIDTILGAAKVLQERGENVKFELIGKGQTYKAMTALADQWALKNIRFAGAMPMQELPGALARADVCLGIFGTTAKAGRVIPNKAYEIISSGKPLITGDTEAARRVFTDGETALLSAPGNPENLAEKILLLRKDTALRQRLGIQALHLSQKAFQPVTIMAPLHAWLQTHLS